MFYVKISFEYSDTGNFSLAAYLYATPQHNLLYAPQYMLC